MWHFQNMHTSEDIQNSRFPLVVSLRALSHSCDAVISTWPPESFVCIYKLTLNGCSLFCWLSCMNMLLQVLIFDTSFFFFQFPPSSSFLCPYDFHLHSLGHLLSCFPPSLCILTLMNPSLPIICLSSLVLPFHYSIGLSFQTSCPWMNSFRSQTPRTQLTTSCMQC